MYPFLKDASFRPCFCFVLFCFGFPTPHVHVVIFFCIQWFKVKGSCSFLFQYCTWEHDAQKTLDISTNKTTDWHVLIQSRCCYFNLFCLVPILILQSIVLTDQIWNPWSCTLFPLVYLCIFIVKFIAKINSSIIML